jgi:CRISPR-associated protein (TIGR03984 family)
LIWRTNSGFKGRLRTDNEGTKTDIIVAYQVLFGTQKGENANEHFTEIKEARGTYLTLPFGNLIIDDKRNRICIKTHNYVGYNAVNQASYTDCRFVGFYQCNSDKKTALS